MNKMVFDLQPDIIVNNRNKLPGDFATPEQRIEAAEGERAWEACMTLNDSWGYHKADDGWKSSRQVVRNLITCARDGGNYLLNIGPKADGSIPLDSARIFNEVGQWVAKNGDAIYGADKCQMTRSRNGSFTRKGNSLYFHIHYYPGTSVAFAGLMTKAKSARLLATGQKVDFVQDAYSIRFNGLPGTSSRPAGDDDRDRLRIGSDARQHLRSKACARKSLTRSYRAVLDRAKRLDVRQETLTTT
jgi:alpha-L-fucosidase